MITPAPCDPKTTRVVLLKGGTSGEREVSLASGGECAQALRAEGFEVIEVDTAEPDMVERIIAARPDVIFNALHGRDGEDGCVQGLCELLRLPYTGSGVLASALAMDKTRAKAFYIASGIPTPHSVTVTRGEGYDPVEVIGVVGEKCVVKPACEGSALGVSIVNAPSGLQDAIERAFEYDDAVLVERFVEGTEVTVAVLGNDELEALPVIEIVPQESSAFYDFEAKYAANGSDHIIPARISEEQTASCQRIAISAHKSLGCRGVSRSDLIVDASGTCWLLETNTIPGMTQTSLLPDAAARVGIPFGALCKLLVELALEDAR